MNCFHQSEPLMGHADDQVKDLFRSFVDPNPTKIVSKGRANESTKERLMVMAQGNIKSGCLYN